MSNALTNSSNFDPQEGPEDTSFTRTLRHYGEMGGPASYNKMCLFSKLPPIPDLTTDRSNTRINHILHIIHITICSVIKPYQIPRNKSHKRYEKIAENYKALSREINET